MIKNRVRAFFSKCISINLDQNLMKKNIKLRTKLLQHGSLLLMILKVICKSLLFMFYQLHLTALVVSEFFQPLDGFMENEGFVYRHQKLNLWLRFRSEEHTSELQSLA